jgi:hypothetical protein
MQRTAFNIIEPNARSRNQHSNANAPPRFVVKRTPPTTSPTESGSHEASTSMSVTSPESLDSDAPFAPISMLNKST